MAILLGTDGDVIGGTDGDELVSGASAASVPGVAWQSVPIPQYGAADYLAAFLGALPRGRAWPRFVSTILVQVLSGLMPGYVRNNADAIALVADAFPATTVNLLPEWEASLGLPDLCDSDPETLARRQQNLAARFAAGGGQSIAYFTGVAAALGYSITITEFAPFRFGGTMAQPLYGDGWAHVWQVAAPAFAQTPLRFGACMNEPFETWGNTALQCTLRRLAPAHTTVIFSYF